MVFNMKNILASLSILLLTTSAFAGKGELIEDNTAEQKTIRSAKKVLTPKEMKVIANLPPSNALSYQHWARPDLIKVIGVEKFKDFLIYDDPAFKNQSFFKAYNMRAIKNNPGDDNHYGSSFHAFSGIEVPFLIDCYSPQDTVPKKVFETPCADGKVVWKATMAGAEVTANELSLKEFELLDKALKARVPSRVNTVTKLPGSCFDVLPTNPHLRGTFDLFFSKNLLHFFNDLQLTEFAQLTNDLLKEGGRAYITANTVKSDGIVYELFLQGKQESVALPGFLITTLEDILLNDRSIVSNIVKALPGESGQSMSRKVISRSAISEENLSSLVSQNPQLMLEAMKGGKFEKFVYEQPVMFADTESLATVFEKVGLKTLEAFYLNEDGKRQDQFDNKAVFISAIFEKPIQAMTTTSSKAE